MVKNRIKYKSISKFLNLWDKEIYNLNLELKKINLKQKNENVILKEKEGLTFRVNK